MLTQIKNLSAFILFAILISCNGKKAEETKESSWSSLAVQTEKYIQNAKYTTKEGTNWKIMPDSVESLQGGKRTMATNRIF